MRMQVTVCFFLHLLLPSVTAIDSSDAIDWEDYETGALGPYPRVHFQTTSMTAPLVHVTTWNNACQPGYTLLTPQGSRVHSNKALLIDRNGHLVWHHQEQGSIKSLQVQRYRDNDYLTFWVGDDRYRDHGRGYYKMLDQTYTHTYTISALNGADGDYHEFSITADNTALITAWQKIPWDLTHKGREDGYIWDCLFQEIDIETETLLYEWRASEHFAFDDMNVDSWAQWTGREEDPWDWFHLNGVEKDSKGNYLISARYSGAISYINGSTGEFIWHLGGRHNSFLDLSTGNATRFVDPHMARWMDESTISVFDMVDFWTIDQGHEHPRGLKIKLGHRNTPTAKALAIFSHPEGFVASGEGSMQHLPNGHYFLSYGTTNTYAEFAADGKLLCSAHYAPAKAAGHEQDSDVATYRVYKHAWVGRPLQSPDVKFTRETLYWSWNGATEVQSWQIEGGHRSSRRGTTRWTDLGIVEPSEFETAFDFPDENRYRTYRLTARDAWQNFLGAWTVDRDGTVREIALETFVSPRDRAWRLLLNAIIFSSLGLLWYLNRNLLRRDQKGRNTRGKASHKTAD